MLQRKTLMMLIGGILACCLLVSLIALPVLVSPANEWMFKATQIDALHALGLDGAGITIGLIGTGVDSTHPEFDSETITLWVDLVNNQEQPYDDADHGTHLAALLVGKGSYTGLLSGVHLKGIAPEVDLVVIKAVSVAESEFGYGDDSRIAQAIVLCIEESVDIICLDLGLHPSKFFENGWILTKQAINQATNQGILVICPAGDDGLYDDADVAVPGTLPLVISVGSVNKQGMVSLFSSRGRQHPETLHPHKKPELVAPGEALLSARVSSSYGVMSGTTHAAVVVAGVVALLIQAYPRLPMLYEGDLLIHLIKDVLAQTGSRQEFGMALRHNDYQGYGCIQAYDAYVQLALYI